MPVSRRSLATTLAVSVTLGATLLGIAGCGDNSAKLTASSEARMPVSRDGGYEVTVPALWANAKKSTSGIEPARIWATKAGASRFTIDLRDLQSKGAGSQWTAASAAAAAVGSMVSGVNPGTIDVDFIVTGPIDGPSAGGILTVGVLAALLDAPIRGDMTMTGTISPDGSIGPIGGVDLKLKAAAAQGYSRVLLPLANMTFTDSATNASVSATDAGKKLGLDVRGVANVQEAFTLFTDGKFAYPSAEPFVLPSAVAALTEQQSANAIDLLNTKVQALPSDADTSIADALLSSAQSSAKSGKSAAAYGIASQGLYVAGREEAASAMRTLITRRGMKAAATSITTEIADQSERIASLLSSSTRNAAELGYEQLISMPNVLGWLTYDKAILNAASSILESGALKQATAERVARILSDTRLDLDLLFPDQERVLRTAPSRPNPGASAVASYLSSYTTFLVTAAKAQTSYVKQVVLDGADPVTAAASNDFGLLLPVVLNLETTVDSMPTSPGTLETELVEASTAITYYIATTSLIAAAQGFGVDQFGIGMDPGSASSPTVLNTTVATAALAVNQVSALLAQRDLDASVAFWGTAVATGASEELAGTAEDVAIDVRALNELYFDGINVFMLQSGPVG